MISKKTSLHYIKPQSIAPVLEPKTPDKRPYNEAIIPAGKENFKDLRRETKLDQEFEKGEGGFALTNVPSPFAGKASSGRSAWTAVWVILIGLTMAAGGAYLVYKYRLRSYMDSEIRAIMAQYMPLDSQAEVPNYVNENRA